LALGSNRLDPEDQAIRPSFSRRLLTVPSLLIRAVGTQFSLGVHLRSRVTNFRIKLSKIVVSKNFRATKNSISVPTFDLARSVAVSAEIMFAHCRDKIEFNLKSQKLEELAALSFESALLCLREVHFSYSLRFVNRFFEFFRFSRSPLSSLSRFLQPHLRGGTRKVANELWATRGIFKKVSRDSFSGAKKCPSNCSASPAKQGNISVCGRLIFSSPARGASALFFRNRFRRGQIHRMRAPKFVREFTNDECSEQCSEEKNFLTRESHGEERGERLA
jgi:hypothetical protein